MKNLLLFVGSFAFSLNIWSQTTVAQDHARITGKTASTSSKLAQLEENEVQKISLYPNPATEYFEVRHPYDAPIDRLVIRDNNGRRIRTYDKPKPEKFFIADLDPGVYSVIVTIMGETFVERLIIP